MLLLRPCLPVWLVAGTGFPLLVMLTAALPCILSITYCPLGGSGLMFTREREL